MSHHLQPRSLRRLILDNYEAAGYTSARSLGVALAKARNQPAAAGIRAIRRWTQNVKPPKNPSGISDANAITLASLLRVSPDLFEPFVTQRRAGAEAAQLEALEDRVQELEQQIQGLLRDRRGGQGGSA